MREENLFDDLMWIDMKALVEDVTARYEVQALQEITGDWVVVETCKAIDLERHVDNCPDTWGVRVVRLTREIVYERGM